MSDVRPWPPASRERAEHEPGCGALMGGRGDSGDRCTCQLDLYNDQLESFWEGYDAAKGEPKAFPTREMDEREEEMLVKLHEAMHDPNVQLHIVTTFTHGRAIQVKIKSRKIGPLIFPPEGGTLGDVLALLGLMLDD